MPTFADLDSTHLDAVVEINNAGYPAVPHTTRSELEQLADVCSLAWVVLDDAGEVAGFVMAVDPGADYDSENYRFFESHYRNHLYIDRVVLGDSLQGQGVGTTLYSKVFDFARHAGRDFVTCEVNLEPPNPGSLRFHHRQGFDDVSTQATKGGAVVVQLLAAPLASES
ncbi:GNAT family N-acetyltransferase [Pontimonas sp.]|nr:GNAT family N-acetyltransferase [Pontimonas sp.]